MAGKIVHFPQTSQGNTLVAQAQSLISGFGAQGLGPQTIGDGRGIHLVQPGASVVEMTSSISQHHAMKIVAEIKRLQKDMPPATGPAILNERSPQFWATLPIPDSGMETPLTIARRLVHLLVASPA